MNPTTFKRNAGEYFRTPSVVLIFISFLISLSCTDQKVSETQKTYLTPDIMCGTVQFSDGCSPKLDTLIAFGIALIHHMTYDDAEYTFNKVLSWIRLLLGILGKAMTYIHPLWPDIPDEKTLNDGFALSQNALKLAETEKENYTVLLLLHFLKMV